MRKLLVAMILAWASPGVAAPPDVLEAHLLAIDTVPSEDDLRALGPGVPDVIGELYRRAADPEQPLFVRARAASLLGLVPEQRALDLLAALAAGPDEDVASTAAYTAARAFGSRYPEAALEVASQALRSPSALVRRQAAAGLRWVALREPARAALQARLAAETDALVRAAIERTLSRLAAGP